MLTAIYAFAGLFAFFMWLTTVGNSTTSNSVAIAFNLINIPVSHSLVSSVVLLLITRALVGRKRIGLRTVIAFQVIGTAMSLWYVVARLLARQWPFSDWFWVWSGISAVLGLAMLWWLWQLRSVFSGRLQPGALLSAVLVAICGWLIALGVGWLLLDFTPAANIPRVQRFLGLVSISVGNKDTADAAQLYGLSTWQPAVVSLVMSVTLVVAVIVFLRSSRSPSEWSGDRELDVRRLLHAYGERDSLGYFATRRDKSSVFSQDNLAVVTYRVINGVSLASGDPVGRPESWPDAVARWLVQAREFGWTPAVLGASEDGARVFVEQGLRAINFGDEALLDAQHFDLRKLPQVRRAFQRVGRAGVECQIRRQDTIEPSELVEIVGFAEAWRGGEPDRGFSMALNREQDPADDQTLILTARDSSGALLGILSFVPWGRHGISLDVMRRNPDAPNGLIEFMVATLMGEISRLGIRRVSLNFCMFRSIYADSTRLGSGLVTKINYSVLGTLDRFFQLERLYVSNQKFEPHWYPRFACLHDHVSLPQVALAAGMAEGFVPQMPWMNHPKGRVLTSAQLGELRAIEATPVSSERFEPRRTDQTKHRLEHVAALADLGHDPYPIGVAAPTHRINDLDWGSVEPVRVAGRIKHIRNHGGVTFATLVDGADSIQVMLERDLLGADHVEHFRRFVDTADLVALTGTLAQSRNETPALAVTSWQVLAKSLHPVPFDRFEDPETRLRQRVTDLVVHPEAGTLLVARSKIVSAVRRTLDHAYFTEVETPILQTVHGGASARPFKTFSNTYGMDLSMRIAPELYLKRLVTSGLGAVYEVGRNFRNEGADATHNPEFTALEAYQPFADYNDMRRLAQELVLAAATAVYDAPLLPLHTNGSSVLTDVSAPWPAVAVIDAVSEAVGHDVSVATPASELALIAQAHHVQVRPEATSGQIIEELYGELVEPQTIAPTFYCDFPTDSSPLAAPHRSQPGLAERWDLVINGTEVGTAYSELANPIEQRRRLLAQSMQAAAGDFDAMELDEDFLRALEIGMPPTGGLGIGIDRLAMLILDTNIRGVLSFPFVKPLKV